MLSTKQLKSLIRTKYAFPGGYEILFIIADGELASADWLRENWYDVCYDMRRNSKWGGYVVNGYVLDCDLEPDALENVLRTESEKD